MSDLSLELSEKFRDEADGIQAELSKHLKVGRPSIVFRRSADPTLPSFIQLLGDAGAWQVLHAAAVAGLTLNGRKPPIFHSLSRIFPTYMKVKRKS